MRALENGVDTIEHGFYLDEEAPDLFVETDATFVPTLAVIHRIVTQGADHGVPEYGLEKARESREAHESRESRESREAHVEAPRRTRPASPSPPGRTSGAGTRATRGERVELELLVTEVGMSEAEAIAAARGVASRTVPADDVGHLDAGDRADLLVVGSDPLADVSALWKPGAVYRGGEPVDL